MIHDLAGIKSGDKVIFVCPKCGRPPEPAMGAANKDQLVYVWLCWRCGGLTLGEWASIEERDNELRGFAERVKVLA